MKNLTLKAKADLIASVMKTGWLTTARKTGKPVSVLSAALKSICENPGARLSAIAKRHNLLSPEGKIELPLPEIDSGDNLHSLFLGKGTHVEKR